MKMKTTSYISYLMASTMLLLPAAIAQDADNADGENTLKRLGTVTVTAEKREENLQDVTASIQAVDGDTLVEQSVVRLDDLDNLVPNLFITEGLTGNTLNIRGIGTSQGNAGFEQSVATFADGIYIGRSRQSVAPLSDVAQVEVLRGPQPVYFGQSAVAGALNITTRDGTGPFSANADLSYASDNEVILAGGVTIPLSDTFGVRVAGRYTDMDGWMTNTFTGEDWAGLQTDLIRVTANWQATDAFDLELKWETGSAEQNGTPAELVGCDPANRLTPFATLCERALAEFGDRVEFDYDGGTSAGGAARTTIPLTPAGSRPITNEIFDRTDRNTDTDLLALTWNYDFGPATLTGISALSEYDFDGAADIGGVPYADVHPQVVETYEQTSHEIRIASNEPVFNGFLDYLVGVYYQDTETVAFNETFSTFPQLSLGAPVQTLSRGDWNSEDTWTSVFGSFTGNFSDTLRGTLGLRYTEVEKDGGAFVLTAPSNLGGLTAPFAVVSANPAVCDDDGNGDGFVQNVCQLGSIDTDDLSYQLGVEWDATDDIMWFATYTEAFKAGGLSQVLRGVANDPNTFEFDDEESTNFEVGVRSILLDNTLRFNANLFVTEYTDLQVSSYDVNTDSFNVQNAAEATSQGIEFDGEWLATDQLTFTFSGSILDAAFDSFPGAQCSQYEQAVLGGTDCYLGPPNPADVDGDGNITDRAGFPLLFSPDYTFNIGGNYTFDVTNSLEATLSGNFNYSDDYYVSDRYDPRETDDLGYGGIQSAVERVDLRVEISSKNAGWSLAIFGNNVTDERPLTLFGPAQLNGGASGFAGGSRGEVYGVQLRAKFGD